MALFSSAADTFLSSPFLSGASSSGRAVVPPKCCQPKKLGASLAKVYSPECVEGVFCELRLYGVLGSTGGYAYRNAEERRHNLARSAGTGDDRGHVRPGAVCLRPLPAGDAGVSRPLGLGTGADRCRLLRRLLLGGTRGARAYLPLWPAPYGGRRRVGSGRRHGG